MPSVTFFIVPPSTAAILLVESICFAAINFVFMPIRFMIFVNMGLFIIVAGTTSIYTPFIAPLAAPRTFRFALAIDPDTNGA